MMMQHLQDAMRARAHTCVCVRVCARTSVCVCVRVCTWVLQQHTRMRVTCRMACERELSMFASVDAVDLRK